MYLHQVENEIRKVIQSNKRGYKQKEFDRLVKTLKQFRIRGFTNDYLINILDTEEREEVLTPSEMQRIGRLLRDNKVLKKVYYAHKGVWKNTIYNIL